MESAFLCEGRKVYKKIDTLLEKSKDGDLLAKGDLLIELKPLILSSIRRYYNRLELYDDLIQEGYEVILLSIDDYEADRGVYFLGYIKTQLKYHYLNKHKEREYLSVNKVIDHKGTEIIDLIQDDEKELLEKILDKEKSLDLLEALDSLTDRQREVICQFYIKDLSLGEIGEKLGIAYRTVVNTKTRALNILKETIVK